MIPQGLGSSQLGSFKMMHTRCIPRPLKSLAVQLEYAPAYCMHTVHIGEGNPPPFKGVTPSMHFIYI